MIGSFENAPFLSEFKLLIIWKKARYKFFSPKSNLIIHIYDNFLSEGVRN